MKTRFLATLLLPSVLACVSSAPGPDPASKFSGRWTYELGSSIVVDCPGAASQTIDLSRVPPANQPGYFSLTPADAADLHEVDARGCQYNWSVAGGVATAAAGQSCATFPDGRGGNRLVHLSSGTKSTSDGAVMTIDVHFVTDAPSSCAIAVRGTATKS
jgi:hypothetical protein